MYFYKAYGLKISSDIELPELSESASEELVDLSIEPGKIELPKLKKTVIYRRGARALFGQDIDGNPVLHWENVATFKAVNARTLIVDSHTDDPDLLSLFIVSEALGLILFQMGFFLLHASAIKIAGKAWCFMGNPGAGKSSTAAAFIKAGCKLLNDDLTAIKFDENGSAYILPAYPQLKIWDKTVIGLQYDKTQLTPVSEGINKFSFLPKSDFEHEPVVLDQIFFIHKAKNRPSIQRLSGHEIPIEMLKNFPLPPSLLIGEQVKQHFVQSFMCAKSAQIWKKRRPEGFENLEQWVRECVSAAK